jgi:hypothetical protein
MFMSSRPSGNAKARTETRASCTSCSEALSRFAMTVELSNEGILFACAETHRTIVVLLVDARVAVTENRTGEMRMSATVDGGC